jgi:preprotein translocase subunit SecA
LQGSPVQFDLSVLDKDLAAIGQLEGSIAALSEDALRERWRAVRERAVTSSPPDPDRALAFALIREASTRALGQRPFDEQIVAGLALEHGAVVEMQTGEGKTLTAVMPAARMAVTGLGVHVLTFNDYLARRDAEWMGPVYRMLGLSVAHVEHGMTPAERRASYRADLTYVTAKEAGFDYLRDLLVYDPPDLVHRAFHAAIVDEADSLMIDEARVPLVIAGSIDGGQSQAAALAHLVAGLTPGNHFTVDVYGRDVNLTESGIELVERTLDCGSLHGDENYRLLTEINCALHAHALLRRDVDYIVRNGRITIVDEFTGRVVEDRHWPDGLQAALEAKEGLESRTHGRILGSITLQHFFRLYPRLSGMTGTAQPAADELRQFYDAEVVVIPTHRPMIRVDHPDVVFGTRAGKERALVEEVVRVHQCQRPVLVGTSTIEESERIAAVMRDAGVACRVLNAKNDESEAGVIADAGAPGSITISTNMAGRGTDIRLGGRDAADHDRVVALGGLYVIGTNRHESRRVDQQLRGRAGRQGDPGESRFFVSLEDDLLVRYGIRNLIPSRFLAETSDGTIDDAVVRREIARAQRIIEGQNFEIRRTISKYTTVVDEQQRRMMERRQDVLHGREIPGVWQRHAARHQSLVDAVGEESVTRAEKAVTLFEIDNAWRDHLGVCADLREGIHLVRLGGQDPLTSFTAQAIKSFSDIDDQIDKAIESALESARVRDGQIDLAGLGIKAPGSTWTYLINDDPFRDRIGALLTGPGGATVAIFSAALMMPLLVLWGLVDRYLGKGKVRQCSARFYRVLRGSFSNSRTNPSEPRGTLPDPVEPLKGDTLQPFDSKEP